MEVFVVLSGIVHGCSSIGQSSRACTGIIGGTRKTTNYQGRSSIVSMHHDTTINLKPTVMYASKCPRYTHTYIIIYITMHATKGEFSTLLNKIHKSPILQSVAPVYAWVYRLIFTLSAAPGVCVCVCVCVCLCVCARPPTHVVTRLLALQSF